MEIGTREARKKTNMKKIILIIAIAIMFVPIIQAQTSSWLLNGNTNAVSSSFIGTTNGFNYGLFLDDNGNVGIGTGHPQAKLTVDGNICAKEVRVALSGSPCWPDYVFEEGYKLMKLIDLDVFLKTNKHFPDVPSAEEVEQGGIDLGEMNAILLQKIEEMTLYIIDLQRQIDELKTKGGE